MLRHFSFLFDCRPLHICIVSHSGNFSVLGEVQAVQRKLVTNFLQSMPVKILIFGENIVRRNVSPGLAHIVNKYNIMFDMLSDCPKPVEISGVVNGSAAVGTVLTCTGARDDLWSPSSYLWINVDDGTTVTGDSFTVAEQKLYKLTCTVYYSSPGDTGNVNCSSHGSFEVTGNLFIVITLSTVGYTSVTRECIHSRQWYN